MQLYMQFREFAGTFMEHCHNARHVVVDSIYTRCTKQCGLMTANLARVRRELGDRVGKDGFFVSVSLDPRDTPEVTGRRS